MSSSIPDTEHIIEFVQLCRYEHIAPYPVGRRAISECTSLSLYRVRAALDQLLGDGRLTKMPAYPAHGVVLPLVTST